MKIVQINSECGRGSTGKIAVAISDLLTSQGIENKIFYSGNHKSDFENGWMISGKLSIRIHQILSRLFGNQGFHSYFATKRMVKRIEHMKPDAILMHNLHGYYIHLEVLFKFLQEYEGKVYWTLHDCWAFTGHCTHFILENCEKWKIECNCCTQTKKYPYSWFFDRSKELFNRKKKLLESLNNITIITPSEWLANLVRESFLGKFPLKVINNGIDLEIFKPTDGSFREKFNLTDKKILLGVSSVWSNEKGLDLFNKLADELDESSYQIVMVGIDKDKEKQLSNKIISIPRTQNQIELAKIYSAADVFVNPTREDNYPTVNMEALACGTPVVTFNTGGCKEIVTEECGIVTKENSIEELISGILKISDKDEVLNKKLLNVRNRYNQKNCFEKYLDLLTS